MPKKIARTEPHCPVEYAFQRIGGRHKGGLLAYLRHGPLRYGQLRRLLVGTTPKMLTQALRELEADGLISRHVFLEVPPRVEYSLLENGRQLIPFILLLKAWGEQQLHAEGIPVMPAPNPHLFAKQGEVTLNQPTPAGLGATRIFTPPPASST